MIIKRKLFSKNKEKQERSKTDIASDAAVGAGIGAFMAGSGRLSYEKVNKPMEEVTKKSIERNYRRKSNWETRKKEAKHFVSDVTEFFKRKKSDSLAKNFDKDSRLKEIGTEFINNKEEYLNKPMRRLEEATKSGKKLYRPAKKVGKYAMIGAGIGAAYGLGNNLKKQRKKIEDAAGDKVAKIIRGK